LDKELWHFYCEIYCDSTRFKNDSEIKTVVNDLLKRLDKPLIEYEVLIPLEKHLQLSGHAIELAGVRFLQMSDDDIRRWGIDKNLSVLHEQFCDAIVGNVIALTHEQCHGFDKAVDCARKKLNTALDMLRVALLIDHEPRIVSWRIWDEQMLFHADQGYAVREKLHPSKAHFGFESQFSNWQLVINDTYMMQIDESKHLLDLLFRSPYAQSKIYSRLRRALEWIGGSVTRERSDDKIVDICTALETLLSTKDEGRKGEAIVLRMMLLYSRLKVPFFDPVKLFELYIKRSNIVHGSERDICLDSEYKSAQWIATDVFQKVFTYIQSHNITQHSDFITELESDREMIENSANFWQGTRYHKDISTFASTILIKRFPDHNS